jgi:aspartyl-tRNA(Asn)/glutamyl-tRNA(Gln) amidotransferase subunit C
MSKKEDIQIDQKLVKEIANLARLDLTTQEIEVFISQFKDILKYFSILDEVDTDQVPPAYLSSANKIVMREDVIEESVPTNVFLTNVPQSKDSYVVIPRVHIEQ